jgi:endonuclease G
MGVGKKNANGEYIDKNGDVIPEKNGKIDASKIVWIANEGIRISVILKDLFLNFPNHQLVSDLKKRPDDGLAPRTKQMPMIKLQI